ncbi:MAG: hypothetical protein Fur0025_25290 [Oscillatoriaceae cyanobacterium]
MSPLDMRGEIYRGWILVPFAAEDAYFYEFHTPEGYRNINLQPFNSPEAALAYGRDEIDKLIEIFEQAA